MKTNFTKPPTTEIERRNQLQKRRK